MVGVTAMPTVAPVALVATAMPATMATVPATVVIVATAMSTVAFVPSGLGMVARPPAVHGAVL